MTQQERTKTINSWMRDYGRLVYSVAYKILINRQDAEDVFQNTFTKAYFKMGNLTGHGNIKAWLSLTAKNDALNKVKSSWKSKVSLVEAPLDLAQTNADAVSFANLIGTLPAVYRKTIWLHYFAGYKTDEIAELMGVAHSTVRSRLKRGRHYLKADLQDMQGSESI